MATAQRAQQLLALLVVAAVGTVRIHPIRLTRTRHLAVAALAVTGAVEEVVAAVLAAPGNPAGPEQAHPSCTHFRK